MIDASPGVDDGWLDVRLDGQSLMFFTEDDAPDFFNYELVRVDVAPFADGGEHLLEFSAQENGTTRISFFVDDVSLDVGPTCNLSDITWLTVSAPLGSGMLPGGTTASAEISTISLNFNAAGLTEGTYQSNLCIASNDPTTPVITVPITMDVVESINHPPVAVDDTVTTPQDTTLNIDVLSNDTDPDGDILMVVEVSNSVNGTTAISGTKVVYTPDNGFTGTDSFTYTISDNVVGNPLTDTGLVTVTVTPPVTETYGVIMVAPITAITGTGGSTITYTVWITNTGNTTNTVDVTNFGLPAVNLPTVVGPLGTGMGMILDIPIVIPGVTNSQSYVTTVRATSQGDTGQIASVTLTTTALVEDTSIYVFLPLVIK
jgi:hypothetical protein